MTTKEQDDPKTAKLLAVAMALRAHQLAYSRAKQAIAVLEANKKAAQAVLEDAELELAETDAHYANARIANARLKVLRLIHKTRRLEIIQTTKAPETDPIRWQLWRFCVRP